MCLVWFPGHVTVEKMEWGWGGQLFFSPSFFKGGETKSWPGKCGEDLFSAYPQQHLLAITYQQANQLSHWPCALWPSLVQCVTVMEGWACPGVHCSHREYMGHNQWVARLVCTRECFLACPAPGKLLPAPLLPHQNPYSTFFSSSYSTLVTLDIRGETRIGEWQSWVMSCSSGKHSRHYGTNVLSALKGEGISCCFLALSIASQTMHSVASLENPWGHCGSAYMAWLLLTKARQIGQCTS